MIHTIARLEDVNGGTQALVIDIYGNQYAVSLFDYGTHMCRFKTYTTLEDAIRVFQIISAHIIRGNYTYEDRAAML